ncbi:MAG TPA: rhodanese-like domain-containing protein [Syntrophales bacterium]|nr:rhodanese-like domain-containing protein [Syntrophales bacterium]HPI57050.1 rhodanese-like domain-containing protein [Syntrophales bacterium]HPN23820.1 rhodanese-like domain-containing protein [Syntrophales bacterium]HQM30037.1 rhodanese-like domain-containing protein [Syntrophales bacterium]
MQEIKRAAIVTVLILFATACVSEKPAGEVPGELPATGLSRMMESERVVLVNTMSDIECMDHRIPGSLCLSCEEAVEKLGRIAVDKAAPVVFYCESERCYRSCLAAAEARKQHYQRVYTLKGGLSAWRAAGYGTESPDRIPRQPVFSVRPSQAASWLAERQDILVLDIRSRDVFTQGHIQGAVNIPMHELHRSYGDIPHNRRIIVVDQNGYRSFLAASYLVRKGFGDVIRLLGGMDRWNQYQSVNKSGVKR